MAVVVAKPIHIQMNDLVMDLLITVKQRCQTENVAFLLQVLTINKAECHIIGMILLVYVVLSHICGPKPFICQNSSNSCSQ